MILELNEIEAIILENPYRKEIKAACDKSAELRMHMFGDGLDKYIEKINSFENADQYAIRKKYARSNRDLIARIMRPVDKVFSAAGGATYYDLPERSERELRNRLRSVENGLSLRKWIEQYWLPAYLADPMGLIFMEIDEAGNAYPTYKGIDSVFSYKMNGRTLDWVIFKTTEKQDDGSILYRVVDDRADYMVRVRNGVASIIEDQSFPNHFGFVPAIIASDIPVFGSDSFDSPIGQIIELADEFLRECSVKSVYKMLHGFPKYWEYGTQCTDCMGTGWKDGEKCPTCKGTGIKLRHDVSDVHVLVPPDSKEAPIIAPNVAGYTVPAIDAWNKMSDELALLETLMFETIWGTKQSDKADNNTATGRFIDTQPVNDRLSKFADAAESIETYITDAIGSLYYAATYRGASVSYGRRFQVESPDTLWDKYSKARASGAPDGLLDDMLRDYIQSKYDNNKMEAERQLKLAKVEPFVHLNISQVQSLGVPEDDYLSKLYFSEFIAATPTPDIITASVTDLKQRLLKFIQNKKKHENTGSN